MSPVLFLDANVPIYAAGRPHPLKEPCAQILALVARHPREFVTDAEVLQELLHRYLALGVWSQGRIAFTHFAEVMRERVEPVSGEDVELAASMADQPLGLAARDLLHAAVMARLEIRQIVSADADFDRLVDLERLDPADLAVWRETVGLP
jgi:predicted nucleic acid-binding protein